MNEQSETNNFTPGYIGIKRLAKERPDWIPIAEVCLDEAKSITGDFAGKWILDEFKKRGLTWRGKGWFPNLKPLVTCGILQRTGGSRGGRRAYYLMPDIKGAEKALSELSEI